MSNLGQLIEIPTHGDERGSLSVAEIGGVLPFVVRRAYWIHGTKPGVARGFHAHRKLNQLCVCVSGSVRLVLTAGQETVEVVLNRPDRGLLIGPGVWREMHDLSADCVLLVLADGEYDEADYVRKKHELACAGSGAAGPITFGVFSEESFKMSQSWLQNEKLRHLIDAPVIIPEKQKAWFESLSERRDYFIWTVHFYGAPIGAVGLKNIADGKAEYFGYIGEERYWGRGVGGEMMEFAEKKARELGINTLELFVVAHNTRAQVLYLKKGFKIGAASDGRVKMTKKLL